MIERLAAAIVLQAVPSATADWHEITRPGADQPMWIDAASVRGPRTHRDIQVRIRDLPTRGFGYMTPWIDCEHRTMTVTAVRTVDPAGKVVFDQQFAADRQISRSYAEDDQDADFHELVCR